MISLENGVEVPEDFVATEPSEDWNNDNDKEN